MYCRWCKTEVSKPCSENSENKKFENLSKALSACVHYNKDTEMTMPKEDGIGDTSFDLTGHTFGGKER